MKAILLLLVFVLAVVALFAVQNPGFVTVNFLGFSGRTSLLAVIAVPFGLGVVAGFLGGIPGSMRSRRRIRDLEARLEGKNGGPATPPAVFP